MEKNKKLNFALVGCGRIAQRHSELLGTGKIENASLSAVCDIDIAKAEKIGKKYNVPYFEDAHEMLKKMGEQINIITILTPSGMHAKNCLDLIQYKKHFVIEKPIALKLEDADEMISACNKNNLKLFIVKQNRFNLPVQKLREALEEGRFKKLNIGTIRVRWSRDQKYYDQDSWRGTWLNDGGVFTNQASHHIDLLTWMMGPVESIFAKASTRLSNIEVDDTGVCVLKFKNGALGTIEATTATRPKDLEGSVSILGEGGSVEIGGFAVNEMKVWNFVDSIESDKDILRDYKENPPNVYGFSHLRYLDHVVKCVLNGSDNLVDGLEARKSLEIIHAIYQSIETNKEVFFNEQIKSSKLGIG